MSEEMREVIEGFDVTGIADKYPNVRKITVDSANEKAFVFSGRSNRAATVTGAEFDALVKMLPPAVENGQVKMLPPAVENGQESSQESDQGSGEKLTEQKKRGKSEKAAE